MGDHVTHGTLTLKSIHQKQNRRKCEKYTIGEKGKVQGFVNSKQ